MLPDVPGNGIVVRHHVEFTVAAQAVDREIAGADDAEIVKQVGFGVQKRIVEEANLHTVAPQKFNQGFNPFGLGAGQGFTIQFDPNLAAVVLHDVQAALIQLQIGFLPKHQP